MFVNRITPAVGAQHYQTYALRRPHGPAYWRENLTCEQVDCERLRLGWKTIVDERTELGQRQAHYVRNTAGRRYTEQRVHAFTEFVFVAGQPCFENGQHRAELEREPLYVVRGGDWRGNPSGRKARVHARGADWVDDMATNQDRIKTARERG